MKFLLKHAWIMKCLSNNNNNNNKYISKMSAYINMINHTAYLQLIKRKKAI